MSAFPAIVGPVLLIDLLRHDERFAADAAAGTRLGLVALSAFAAVYARLAVRRGPARALAGAWGAAAAQPPSSARRGPAGAASRP